MRWPGVLSLSALALAAALASGGCYALSHQPAEGDDAEMSADSTLMHVVVNNQNSENVRVFAGRGSNAQWIGTVASMSSETLHVPGAYPGAGSMNFSVIALNGRRWSAMGVPARGGSTVQLDIDGDIAMSSWTTLR